MLDSIHEIAKIILFWNDTEKSEWLITGIPELVQVAAADQRGIKSADFVDFFTDLQLAFTMQDNGLMLVRMLVQGCMPARFHPKIAGDKVGLAVIFPQQDMHSSVFYIRFGGHHALNTLPAVISWIACEFMNY